ncbi:hypothetical protein [Demequina sp.]|uniref:hypothetical protein n=1 Tax=Demequina sp. TaxID=2050685 RepID=UPI003D0C4C60
MNVRLRARATTVLALAALILSAALVAVDAQQAAAKNPVYAISGTVTIPLDAPAGALAGVRVEAVRSDGGTDGPGANSAFVTPDSVTGAYSIAGLNPGEYRVRFYPASYETGTGPAVPDFATEYYAAAYKDSDFTPVDISYGDATGIDATLEWNGSIAGTVTLAPSVPAEDMKGVRVFATSEVGVTRSAAADPLTGAYVITGLHPGVYSIYFDGVAYAGTGGTMHPVFASEVYDNVYSATQGKTVTVASHAAVTGINATLDTMLHFTTTATPKITWLALNAGSTLGSSTGSWGPKTSAFKVTYQWKRNGLAISKATKSTYVIQEADRGTKITLTITASDTNTTPVAKTSAALAIPKVFTKTVTPTISGTLRSGHTLTAIRGTWSPTASYSYQWYRSGTKITGATAKTYKLSSKDKGKKITVKVTGKRTGYLTVTRTSPSKTVAK